MKIDNRLDIIFGKISRIPGILFLLFGILTIGHIWQVLFVIIGAFILFSYSGVQINTETKTIRLYECLFGLFKTGKWKSLELYKGLTIVPVRKVSKVSSMSNRNISVEEKDFRIFLVNTHNKPEVSIKKCKTLDDAQDRIDELSLWLHLPVYTIK